jgi:hypothetical protein
MSTFESDRFPTAVPFIATLEGCSARDFLNDTRTPEEVICRTVSPFVDKPGSNTSAVPARAKPGYPSPPSSGASGWPPNVTYVCNVAPPFRRRFFDPLAGRLGPRDSLLITLVAVDTLTHFLLSLSHMAHQNYRKALYQAKQELAHELVERQKSDQKVARLQSLITQLQDLCAQQNQKGFWSSIERVVTADLKRGITETIRVLLKERSLPMTATELKAGIEARKYDLARYKNSLAVIHTVLNRLVKSGEVKVISEKYGKKAYQWVSTTEKLLSELRETSQPATQRRGGVKEYK